MGQSAVLPGAEILVISLKPHQRLTFRTDQGTLMVIDLDRCDHPLAHPHGLRAMIHAPRQIRVDRHESWKGKARIAD